MSVVDAQALSSRLPRQINSADLSSQSNDCQDTPSIRTGRMSVECISGYQHNTLHTYHNCSNKKCLVTVVNGVGDEWSRSADFELCA